LTAAQFTRSLTKPTRRASADQNNALVQLSGFENRNFHRR